MRVEIISIGDELVRGERADRNGPSISRALSSLGMIPRRVTVVGDHETDVAEVLRLAAARADLIVASGGVGDEGAGAVRALCDALAVPPEELRTLSPCAGSISGAVFESEAVRVFLLPGDPVGLEAMLEGRLLPEVTRMRGEALFTARLRVFGIAPSEVSERLQKLQPTDERTSFRLGATEPEVEIIIRSRGQGRVAAAKGARALAAKVCTELGHAVHGPLGESLSEAVGSALRSRGWSLAVLENGTGGLLSAKLDEAPASSSYVLLGVSSESAHIRREILDLSSQDGPLETDDVAVMAEKVKVRTGASIGLALTCIAGPAGGSPEEPVGLVHFALAGEAGSAREQWRFTGMDRVGVKRRAAASAMAALIDYCRKVAG